MSLVDEVVKDVDISLNSELEIIEALSAAAVRRSKIHDIILMVDLGDLREGDGQMIWTMWWLKCRICLACVWLAWVRIYCVCLRSCHRMRTWVDWLLMPNKLREKFDLKLRYVSGGNSGSLPLLLEKGLPAGINHLRVGEAISGVGATRFMTDRGMH